MKKILVGSSILAVITGILMISGGMWGIAFTYRNVAQEKITTPADASIPGAPVRGPLTLKSQADIIRHHTLTTTGGKTYAEMPRQVQKVDADNKPVVDEQGNPVMVPNTTRDMWLTATTLTTALNLGIVTYLFSGLIILFGLISIWTGIVFYILSKSTKTS